MTLTVWLHAQRFAGKPPELRVERRGQLRETDRGLGRCREQVSLVPHRRGARADRAISALSRVTLQ